MAGMSFLFLVTGTRSEDISSSEAEELSSGEETEDNGRFLQSLLMFVIKQAKIFALHLVIMF